MSQRLFSSVLAASFAFGCAQTSHTSVPGPLGERSGSTPLGAVPAEAGPVTLTKVAAADWAVDLGGMLNLDHPLAEAAQLEDEKVPIQIYFYALRHPTEGLYLVDTGVAHAVAEGTGDSPLSGLLESAMDMPSMKVHVQTGAWLAAQPDQLKGVLLTHLHLDHILGLKDIPTHVPIYVGPGEADDRRFLNVFSRSTTNDSLEGHGALQEWNLSRLSGASLATVDIFGDGSVVGLHIPGHTQGNMAFVVRATDGTHLLTGDGCHTAWGWEHGVEPGSFNSDTALAARSLHALKALAMAHPAIMVHPGHQSLGVGAVP